MTNFHCVFYWNAFVLYGFFSLLLNSGSCFLYFSASFLKSSHFCLHASNIFSLPSVFSCWNMMCLSMVFFVLILFGLTGLISFRIEWLDLLVVQETLKSLFQQHNSKTSILWQSTLWSNFHICTWLQKTNKQTQLWLCRPLLAKCICIICFSGEPRLTHTKKKSQLWWGSAIMPSTECNLWKLFEGTLRGGDPAKWYLNHN